MRFGNDRSEATQIFWTRAFGWTPICTGSLPLCRRVSTRRVGRLKNEISRFGRPPVFMVRPCLIIPRATGAIFQPWSPVLNLG